MKAVTCPICNGTGQRMIKGQPSLNQSDKCHGCDGRGWVEVGGEPMCPFVPIYPLPPGMSSSEPFWGRPEITCKE